MTEPETIVLPVGARVPNSRLPVLLYRGIAPAHGTGLQRLFAGNGWSNSWKNGIYTFHHFHSIAHEVLGIAAGQVEVRLGGEAGRSVALHAGDVVVLPAGTGHKRLSAQAGLEVVGAYPAGCDWDLVRADEVDAEIYRRASASIAAVPLPRTDPVFGTGGPLTRIWAEPAASDRML